MVNLLWSIPLLRSGGSREATDGVVAHLPAPAKNTTPALRATPPKEGNCHRGITSGYSCGAIQSVTYQPTYANACGGMTCSGVFGQVKYANASGDSGGAVFVSGTGNPVGLHVGGDGTGYGIYSSLAYLPAGTSLG